MNDVNTYVFTFGIDPEEYGMLAHKYIKITGTYASARAEMVKMFGTHWACQYELGEYLRKQEKYGLTAAEVAIIDVE